MNTNTQKAVLEAIQKTRNEMLNSSPLDIDIDFMCDNDLDFTKEFNELDFTKSIKPL